MNRSRREWYLTLRENYVSGLITYWEFNRHEFRVQLYTIVSLIEGISRDILAKDGCGVADATGINLDPEKLTRSFPIPFSPCGAPSSAAWLAPRFSCTSDTGDGTVRGAFDDLRLGAHR